MKFATGYGSTLLSHATPTGYGSTSTGYGSMILLYLATPFFTPKVFLDEYIHTYIYAYVYSVYIATFMHAFYG